MALISTETRPCHLRTGARRLWQRARQAGKAIKAHAGECAGAAAVLEVVESLGVRRIEHGVRSLEDPEVVHRLRDLNVTLDVCPISNVKLGVVKDLSEHPIRGLHDAGICCTVNTDDPTVFGNTLNKEYEALAQALHFKPTELVQIARNGFEIALMDEKLKQSYIDQLESVESELSGLEKETCERT